MRALFVIGLLVIAVLSCNSQNIEGGTQWNSKEDYQSVEPQIIENILWLEANPLVEDMEYRKQVGAYVMKWLTGCPHISVTMTLKYEGKIMLDENYEFASRVSSIFLMGKTLYMIQHQDEKKKIREVKSNERGIVSMITLYNELVKEKGASAKNEIMEQYVKMQDEGRLQEFVRSKKSL